MYLTTVRTYTQPLDLMAGCRKGYPIGSGLVGRGLVMGIWILIVDQRSYGHLHTMDDFMPYQGDD